MKIGIFGAGAIGTYVGAHLISGGEDVVIDGQLLLSEGTLIAPRAPKAGA